MSLNHFTGNKPFDAVLGSLTVNQTSADVGLNVEKTGSDTTTHPMEINIRSGDTADFLKCKKDGSTFITLTNNGSLHLGGFLRPIQLPTGSLPAAASYEGNICFDFTTKKLVYSNGTAWIQVP